MPTRDYPKGWDDGRVRGVIDHYEGQVEEEAIAEDEAGYENRAATLIEVPIDLVTTARELIAKQRQ